MLFPWLVDLVRKGHPNQATSFVTRFVGPCIFCKCLRYLSWERTEVTSSFTLPGEPDLPCCVRSVPPSGRQNSISQCFLWKTTGSLSPRTTFCCYLCANSRVGPVCSVQEVQGLSPWGHRGPQSCRCPLAHNSFVHATTWNTMTVLFEIFLMASLKVKQKSLFLAKMFFLLIRIISQCPWCWEQSNERLWCAPCLFGAQSSCGPDLGWYSLLFSQHPLCLLCNSGPFICVLRGQGATDLMQTSTAVD